MAPVREKMLQCQVQRRRVRAAGGYEFFWKVKTVADAVVDGDIGFRCMDCHGSVKLYNRAVPAHVEHRSPHDAAFCASSIVFQQATDGRTAREVSTPVQFTRR